MAVDAGVKDIIYTSSTAVNDWVYMDESAREGGEMNTVFENTKQHPVTFYGATKGATELYLNAIAFKYKIKANIIRPGYTFGNPVVTGADIQSDKRFKDIVFKAVHNEDIELIKNDGTQFIWAGHLAQIYSSVLHLNVTNMMYFGLGSKFITWEKIAQETIKLTNSKSNIILKDLGWSDKPALFDVEGIKRDFGFQFNAWDKIKEHVSYYLSQL
jgi:UDP-glucose 4-epimerase